MEGATKEKGGGTVSHRGLRKGTNNIIEGEIKEPLRREGTISQKKKTKEM